MRNSIFGVAFFCLFSSAIFSITAVAQGVSPYIGLWAINSEVTGEPGRGFSIDVQNETLIMTFYGYERSGEPTFYFSSGAFEPGSNELTMDLLQFEGGTAFGQPFKNAVPSGSAGKVTLRFFDYGRGEICLPGESCKTIRTFDFGAPDLHELVGTWVMVTEELGGSEVWMLNITEVSDGVARGTATINSVVGDFTADLLCSIGGLPDFRYSCAMEVLGEVASAMINVNRNSIAGGLLESGGALIGWRIRTSSGRLVLPN